MKKEKFSNLFTFLPKSKIKAGEGKDEGKYPLYTSSPILSKYYDDAIYSGESLIFGTGGQPSIHYEINKFSTSTDCLIAKKKEDVKTKIYTKYIYYFLKSHDRILEDGFKGAGLKHISKKYISNIKIPLPKSIDDQIKIANLLSQVEALIAKREESIKLLDELLKSTFLDMFGTYDKLDYRLEELCSEIVDCPHSTPKYSDNKTEFSCLRTSEFSNGQIDYSSIKYVNEEEYLKRVKRLIPEFGDVLYAREGSYGDAVRVPKESLICLGQRTMLFRPKIEICNSIFLWALVRSDIVFRQAKKKNKGATVGRVNVKDIKEFKVFLPPKPLQDKFAAIVQQVEESKKRYQESLNQLQQLFGSLSQRAFKGELDLDKMKRF